MVVKPKPIYPHCARAHGVSFLKKAINEVDKVECEENEPRIRSD